MQSSIVRSTYGDNHYSVGPAGYPAIDDRLSDGETWLLIAAFTTLFTTLLLTFA